MHVTIIDDSKDSLETYRDLLSSEFSISTLSSPEELLPHLDSTHTDLILMDLHMPMMNGFELYEAFRGDHPHVPVIFLTGDGSEQSMVKAFSLGVEDFLVKPVMPAELIARIRNKIAKAQERKSRVIRLANLSIYLDHDLAHIDNKILQLTPSEYKILCYIAMRPNKMISREELIKNLWPPTLNIQPSNVDTHLSNLRKKLGPFTCQIKTIKAQGYILKSD
jgi:DNA-binding response OmpR family regulator